jgi:hypothetical protein
MHVPCAIILGGARPMLAGTVDSSREVCMFNRVGTICCVLVLVALTMLPNLVSAAGAPLRGQQITTPTWRIGSTGECICDIQWYTVKLRPGTVTVNANLLTISNNLGPTYSLLVWMNHGGGIVGFAKNTCSRAKRLCNKHLNFTLKVAKAGVYYLKLKGLGGEGISYSIRVRGNIATQRCAKTC